MLNFKRLHIVLTTIKYSYVIISRRVPEFDCLNLRVVVQYYCSVGFAFEKVFQFFPQNHDMYLPTI